VAPPRRRDDPSLIATLSSHPGRFSFFQAVRLLEWSARRDAGDPRKVVRTPVGEDGDPRAEAVKFRSDTRLGFPVSDVQAVAGDGAGPAAMTVTFLGLTGSQGALPDSYSDLVQRALKDKKGGLRDFFDIFNHRLISLFYRAWTKYRLAPSYENSLGRKEQDAVTALLSSLVGLGGDALRDRQAVPDALALHYGGTFSRRVRPAVVVEDLLSGALGRPVRVEQFRGDWCAVATTEQTRLPGPGVPDGQYCQLGVNAVAGARAWEVQGGIRVHIGPLSYAEFLDLLPGYPKAGQLADLVTLATGGVMDFDAHLTLRADQVPPWRLGTDGGCRLGWNSWLVGPQGMSEDQGTTFRLTS
jgi:type VI secretion system protein ImpH